ncbi:hypothetical protein [Pseudalkalibacillus berkeleyi]|uniref:DUF2642 domain-containing protein n=1 Tax=Pseudalkalibacillus berkeleyi TaxID=1069813 RepID=A0ABS9GWZ5_9BACL|nr:hypothetical protein [Pseudalkalibacillus berkeleyi]MCF6137308.1 hypothetical protein [Pseudalkalibacillus berkeleyi]
MKKLPVEGRVIRMTEDRIVTVQGQQIITYNRAYYEIVTPTFQNQSA